MIINCHNIQLYIKSVLPQRNKLPFSMYVCMHVCTYVCMYVCMYIEPCRIRQMILLDMCLFVELNKNMYVFFVVLSLIRPRVCVCVCVCIVTQLYLPMEPFLQLFFVFSQSCLYVFFLRGDQIIVVYSTFGPINEVICLLIIFSSRYQKVILIFLSSCYVSLVILLICFFGD